MTALQNFQKWMRENQLRVKYTGRYFYLMTGRRGNQRVLANTPEKPDIPEKEGEWNFVFSEAGGEKDSVGAAYNIMEYFVHKGIRKIRPEDNPFRLDLPKNWEPRPPIRSMEF